MFGFRIKYFLHFTILAIFFNIGIVKPSSKDFFFEKITSNNGRSFGWITGITTTPDGYLWFSTRSNGLIRYDGYNYKTFKKDSKDSTTNLLADITYLYKDQKGLIWLRHFDQLGVFDNNRISNKYQTITKSNFLFNTKVIEDQQGYYWIGPTKKGLIRFDPKTNTIEIFNGAPSPYENNFNDLSIDNQGNIIVVYPNGISKYNFQKKSFKFIPVEFEKIFNSSEVSYHIVLLPNNDQTMWIGTMHGLALYDLKNKNYKLFKNSTTDTILTSNFVICLYKDRQNRIWVGTDKGLNIIEPDHSVTKIEASTQNGLYSNFIFSIYQDFSNNIWVATQEGLNKLKKNNFIKYPLECQINSDIMLVEDRKNSIWYTGNNNELFFYEYHKGARQKHTVYIPGYKTRAGRKDELIYNDICNEAGYIWLLYENKLIGFNKTNKQTDRIVYVNAVCKGNDSIPNKLFTIENDQRGNLWISSLSGIHCYNIKKNIFTQFFEIKQQWDELYEIDINYIKSSTIDTNNDIYYRTTDKILKLNKSANKIEELFKFENEHNDIEKGNLSIYNKGKLWFASLPDFYSIDLKSLKIEKYSFPSANEISYCNLVTDSLNIWVYSNNGLYRYNRISNEYKSYFYNDGLPDNIINGLVVVNPQQVWLTTSKGLGNFNPRDESISTFYTQFDNQSYSFKAFPRRQTNNKGELFFYTDNHFLYLNTDSFNRHIPQVTITRIDLFGNEMPFDSTFFKEHKLKLKYNQNSLTFHFSALDYTMPEKNRYAYRLEGIDYDWHYTDANSRVATYTNLSPGNYSFTVKACNNDLVWNEKGTNFTINITPPWYKTIFAYIMYVIALVFSLYTFIKLREKQLIKEKSILEQKVVERTKTIAEQRDELEEQKKDITDSINYARRIQTAMLPPECLFEQYFSEFFILYRPRDIVSGDFYWMIEKDKNIIIAAADCTGHGVPGSLMSMLGMAALTEIASKTEQINAADILNQLRYKIISLLRQSNDRQSTKDGMDISICVYNPEKLSIQNAGAFNSIYIMKGNELSEIKADRMPIGIHERNEKFKNNDICVSKGDTIYMYSDGYVDQFNGETNEKFKSKRFQELIKKCHPLTMKGQYTVFDTTMTEWIGNGEQIDDIMLIGFRI